MHLNPVPPTARQQQPLAFRPAYNLFRRDSGSELFCAVPVCAVPEDWPVPKFLNAKGWTFAGKVDEPAAVPLGFNQNAARTGVRLNGYYLFAAFSAVRDTTALRRVRWAA